MLVQKFDNTHIIHTNNRKSVIYVNSMLYCRNITVKMNSKLQRIVLSAKENMSKQKPCADLTNLGGTTVNNKLIILILSLNKFQPLYFLPQMGNMFMEIKPL